LLQLDELVTAVGSPSGAATKDQQQSIWPRKIAERSHRSILIWQAEIRHSLANLRSGLIPVVLRLGEFEPGRGRNLGAAGAHLLDYIVQDCGFGLRFHFLTPSLCSIPDGEHRVLFEAATLTTAFAFMRQL
jgi:hypothetical protein